MLNFYNLYMKVYLKRLLIFNRLGNYLFSSSIFYQNYSYHICDSTFVWQCICISDVRFWKVMGVFKVALSSIAIIEVYLCNIFSHIMTMWSKNYWNKNFHLLKQALIRTMGCCACAFNQPTQSSKAFKRDWSMMNQVRNNKNMMDRINRVPKNPRKDFVVLLFSKM